MNTFLSEAQENALANYRNFARQKIAPVARQLDAHELPLKEFLAEQGQRGYLGLTVPTEFGGQGLPFLNLALLLESVAEEDPGLAIAIIAHSTATELVSRYGSDKQKSRYLPGLARGETIASVALSEETAGTDFQSITTRVNQRNGKAVLTGKKTWVTNGEMAGLAVVLANQAPNGQNPDLVMALAQLGDSKHVSVSPDKQRLGLGSACINDVEFQDLPLSDDWQLLPSGQGSEQALYAMDIASTLLSAAAIGLCQRACNLAVEHARSREQFGKSIGQFQGIQWKLADHHADLQAARLHTLRAAWSKDEDPESTRRFAAMAKWYSAKVARLHSGEAIQVLGSSGLLKDCLSEKLYRDAKMLEILGGTSEFQKMLLVEELAI